MKDIGVVQTHFDFSFNNQDNTFFAESPKGSDKLILGGIKAGVARLFNKKLEAGSLIKIQKGEIKGDSLKGVMTTMFGNFYFRAIKTNDRIHGMLLNGKKEAVGLFDSDLNLNIKKKDYKAIWHDIEKITQDKIYNRSVLDSKKWHTFKKQMDNSCEKFRDDLEFLMGFYYFSNDLGFSHYSAFIAWEDWDKYIKSQTTDFPHKYLDSDTYYVKISSFSGSLEDMNKVLDQVAQKQFKNLVIDLRDNSGGSIDAGMTFAERLVKQDIVAGVFLTRKYYNKNNSLPTKQELNQYDVFSKANYELLLKGISEKEGIVLKVEAKNTIAYQKLYFLVNEKTASTCEPILQGFKENKMALIIGKKSAGKMLNAEEFKIRDGYTLFLPTAMYVTSQGKVLDQIGVEPDILVKEAFSEDSILKYIKN
ncbi:S41 family peptidase [Myroides albus]|uniref:S41 family peptidase n=1 Tax=Myroides albus TaxID=2562892 RepID=UPI00215907AB|nr:S41 family peptidase [Myroides albus]UVD79107.1 S41 family peptidase [Myroides albus]